MGCSIEGEGKYKCKGIKKTVEGHNLAPWVRCQIQGSGFNLTVGNESDPAHGNHAVIKAFQFGTSTGANTTMEILDEEGGNFERFMCKLNTNIKEATADYRMKIQFGWVNAACGSDGKMPISESFYFVPIQCEANYAEGKIRFTITGTSLMEIVFETKSMKTFGTAGTPDTPARMVRLKEAIKQLFSDNEPKVENIKYLRVGPDGNVVDWKFKTEDGGDQGPLGVWQAHEQNKLDAAYRWIKSLDTEKDKGVRATWDPSSASPTLIFWEDPESHCNETIDWCSRSLGTYIVNGGACSPVISFTPSAKWAYYAIQKNGGGTGGPATGESLANKGRPGCESLGEDHSTGGKTTLPFSSRSMEIHGPQLSVRKDAAAVAAHQSANKRIYAMEGELRIQGDPELAGQLKTFGRTVSLIVVNPFHLDQGGSSCGDWLAKPTINPVYSNKAWWIKGVDHFIKEGQYVTTLKVVLIAPGSDIAPDENFGGNPSGFSKSNCSG